MQGLEALRAMLLIRAFEHRLLARPDRGFQLASSGAEAVAVGVCAALGSDDTLLTSGRSIGPALARGLDPGAVLAELLGRTGGPCRGRGGRGHLAQPAAGFFGAHAVVAGNMSVAAGVALAMQSQSRPGVVACLFGDGACGSGALHETLNIATLWRLPLLLVCDDNGWSVSTPRAAALAPQRLADFARPFGIASESVDGMDVGAVADAARRLAAHARAGLGPAFLECASARFTPHSSATRETRTRAQLEALVLRCPIRAHAGALRARGELDDATLAALEHEARARVDDAVAFAEASPMPGPEELLDDVG